MGAREIGAIATEKQSFPAILSEVVGIKAT
jgi:hypothetical protein